MVLVDPFFFVLQSAGQEIHATTTLTTNRLQSGNLRDGELLAGTLAFSIPDSAASISLIFKPVGDYAVECREGGK